MNENSDEKKILLELASLEGANFENLATYDWLNRMNDLVHELENHADIQLERYETHPSVPLVVEETMSDSAGFDIPRELLSFYRVTDGFNLQWKTQPGHFDFEIGGTIHLFGFGEVFGNWIDTLWGVTPENSDAQKVDFSWEVRGIDRSDENQNFWTVLHATEDSTFIRLYFHDPSGESHLLDLNFSEYLEALILTRGIHGWQFLLTNEIMPLGSEEDKLARNCARALKELFPNQDFSILELDDFLIEAPNLHMDEEE